MLLFHFFKLKLIYIFIFQSFFIDKQITYGFHLEDLHTFKQITFCLKMTLKLNSQTREHKI